LLKTVQKLLLNNLHVHQTSMHFLVLVFWSAQMVCGGGKISIHPI